MSVISTQRRQNRYEAGLTASQEAEEALRLAKEADSRIFAAVESFGYVKPSDIALVTVEIAVTDPDHPYYGMIRNGYKTAVSDRTAEIRRLAIERGLMSGFSSAIKIDEAGFVFLQEMTQEMVTGLRD